MLPTPVGDSCLPRVGHACPRSPCRCPAAQAEEEKLNPIEVSINTWQAPTYKLDYPEDLTQEIYDTIRPILESWSGEYEAGRKP